MQTITISRYQFQRIVYMFTVFYVEKNSSENHKVSRHFFLHLKILLISSLSNGNDYRVGSDGIKVYNSTKCKIIIRRYAETIVYKASSIDVFREYTYKIFKKFYRPEYQYPVQAVF